MNGSGNVEAPAVKDRTRGQWREILPAICGISPELLDGRHHPCPKCGGHDRFRAFADVADTGGVICGQCHNEDNGDGLATVMWMNGCGFREALELTAAHLGFTPHKSNIRPADVLTLVAQQKRVSRESLQAYGAVVEQGAVVLPTFDAAGGQLSSFRIKPGGGKAAKGLFQKNAAAGVFLPVIEGQPRLPQAGETWLVVEGPKDAAALHALGYFALGMPTCQLNIKFRSLFNGVRVVLVPDRDKAGWDGSDKTAQRLFGVAADIRRAVLPAEIKVKDGADVRDILAKNGGEALLKNAIETAAEWRLTELIEPEAEQEPADEARAVSLPDGMPKLNTEDGRTEIANGRRLALARGQDMRWVDPWGTFMIWDGRRWVRDKSLCVDSWARECTTGLWNEFDKVREDLAGPPATAITRFITSSRSNRGIGAMMQRARSEKGIPALPEQFDKAPWLLNLANCTLDLRTQQERPPSREDYLTAISPVSFDPAATCPQWEKFVSDIFAANDAMIAYVRRAAGYSLTGDVSEQAMFFCYGKGGNGKSTFLQTLMAVLGTDYSMKAASDLLLVKQGQSHPTELADLLGKRFVACIEAEEGKRVAEAMVKELTGADSIRARRLYEDAWEFTPTHKVWLAANHRPTIRGTDEGIWRRLRAIPFVVTFKGTDKDIDLPQKLLTELPGILNWCLRGLGDWQEHGLAEPKEVQDETSEYRAEMDTLGEFIAECCIQIPGAKSKAGELLDEYKRWSGHDWMTQTKFGNLIKERGFEKERSNGIWYRGIGLRVDEGR